MASREAEERTILVEVPITETDYRRAVGKLGGKAKLPTFLSDAVSALVNGGVVLSQHELARIRDSTGLALRNSFEIRQAIERRSDRRAGRPVLTWTPDPVYEPILQEREKVTGRTPQEQLQDFMDYCIGKGWMFDIEVEPQQILMSKDDLKRVQKAMGEPRVPSGTDIANFICGLMGEGEGGDENAPI